MNIIGIGTDIVEVLRIAQMIERHGEQFINRAMDLGDLVLPGDILRGFELTRRNGDGIEAGLCIGNEMAVTHDEAGADAADAPVLAIGEAREIIQIQIGGHGGAFPRLLIVRKEMRVLW